MSRQSKGNHEGNGDSIPAQVEEDQVVTRFDGRWDGKDESIPVTRSQKLMMKLKTGGPEVTVEGDEGTYVCGGVRVTGERRV
jgi:hypothetical protein